METINTWNRRRVAVALTALAAHLSVLWLVLGGRGLTRIATSLDSRVVFIRYDFLVPLCFAVLVLAVHVALIRHRSTDGSEPRPVDAFFQQSGWLAALTITTGALTVPYPALASSLLLLGWPAVMTLALRRFLIKPQNTELLCDPAHRFWHDGIYTFIAFTLLFWWMGVFFTRTVGEHSGDEGHYLIQASSLYHDGDLDLRNNFASPETVDPRHVHISPNSKNGKWYSWHSPGLSFLLAPTVPGGPGRRHLVLGIISGAGLAALFWLGRTLGASRRSSILVTLLIGLGPFWGIYSSRALPEVLGAALTTYGLLFCLKQRSYPWATVMPMLLCIAFFPWLQARFIPVAITLVGCYGLHGLLGRERLWRKIPRLSLFTLAVVATLAFYHHVQLQMFENGMAYPVPTLLFSLPMGMWHTLASNRGVLYVFPLFACTLIAALYLLTKAKTRLPGSYALLIFLSVLLTSCATIWFTAGACVPGRYLLVVTLVLGACLARALTDARPAFHALTVYLGLMPIGLFAAQLTALRGFGKAFADPFVIRDVHPLFSDLPDLLYNPLTSLAVWPALTLYLVAFLLLFHPRLPSTLSRIAIACLLAVFVVHAPPQRTTGMRPRQTAFRLQNLAYRKGFMVAFGERKEALPLLSVANRFHNSYSAEIVSVTTQDLGQRVEEQWVSVPHLEQNDWDGRGFTWASLTAPFPRGRNERCVVYIEASNEGESEVEIAIREGSETRISARYPAGQMLREVYDFKIGGTGDIYLLMRFVEGEGRFITKAIAASAYSSDLLEKTGLTLDPPVMQAKALNNAADLDQLNIDLDKNN